MFFTRKPKKFNVKKIEAAITLKSGEEFKYCETGKLLDNDYYYAMDISIFLRQRTVNNDFFIIKKGTIIPISSIDTINYKIEDHEIVDN